jgi:cytochrome P450
MLIEEAGQWSTAGRIGVKTWFRTPHVRSTDVDVSSIAFWSRSFDDRDKAFARLRRETPVSWHPPLETPGLDKRHKEAGFWAVTRARDIAYVSRHADLFSSEIGQVGVRPAPFRLAPNMLVVDPPRHTDLRRIVSSAFTPAAIAALEHTIDRTAKRIVLRASRQESFDFVSEIAAPLPLRTVAALVGVPASEEDAFVEAADAHVRGGIPGRLGPGVSHQAYFAEQAQYLNGLFTALAAWKRRNPGEDLMTRLVEAEIDGEPLDDDAIRSTVMLLVVAGDDTTKQAITLSRLALERFPDQRDWLHGDGADDDGFDARFDLAFDELVRYSSPVISFARTATHDVELAGAEIAAGDKVALFYCSGNRDETEFQDPDRLDLRRRASAQVGFGGGGVHFCLGSRLARLQIRAILRETMERLPALELGTPEFGFGESVHAVVSLPVWNRRHASTLKEKTR